ncbi:hypothetical protein [Lacihabitans soyangensis]|uniref:DUF4783 domain-containing protein n=1 Tax=Lacihabitans soyangensis TaxID=869394 RepID=A0AAE3KV50_9BACT|nr:hypothetical protein [Lacihabitans soyangensis]MCP9765639.1 hypothetical protein [Lacihabitans soyangensis]
MRSINYAKLILIFSFCLCFKTSAFTSVNEKTTLDDYQLLITNVNIDKLLVSWVMNKNNKIDFVYLQKSVNRESYRNIAKVYYRGIKAYAIEDIISPNQTVFYRIVLVRKNGNFTFSSTVEYSSNHNF